MVNSSRSTNMEKTIISIGYKCNNNCVFCSIPKNKRDIIRSYDEIISNMEIESQKCDSIEFTGGEPTIRSDFINLVKNAKELGFKLIIIETNGRMFSNPKFTKDAINAGLNRIVFSLHGPEAIHDNLTKVKGSYAQLIKGIKEAKKYDINIYSNFVINKLNYKYMKDYIEIINELKLKSISLLFTIPSGMAAENKLMPTYSEIIPYLISALKTSKTDVTVQNVPFCVLGDLKKYIYSDKKCHFNFIETSPQINLKIKTEKCKNCKHECEGIWKKYYEIYGDKELNLDEIKHISYDFLP
jgi:MoaA/NifB/PqqE/SkfB family radical SAM enzyme